MRHAAILTALLLSSSSALADRHRHPEPLNPLDIVGTYDASHDHWRDTVEFRADGTYARGNGDPGVWHVEGERVAIKWKNWGGELLHVDKNGVMRGNSNFRLVRRAGPSGADVVGVYNAVHPHWRDTVTINRDGTYRRGNGDPGVWTLDGKRLVLRWKNWGPEELTFRGGGAFANRNGFSIEPRRVRHEPPPPPKPVVHTPPPPTRPPMPPPPPVRQPRDCGTGRDDPGCELRKRGNAPLEADEYRALLKTLKSERGESQRRKLLGVALGKRVLTARQFGSILALFNGESVKLQVAEATLPAVVNPRAALEYSTTFKGSSMKRRYVDLVAAAERN